MKSKDFYKSTAWKWFSMYIKLLYAKESNGTYFVMCNTCNKPLRLPASKTHLGHLIKVYEGNNTYFCTAFDERNVLPQCSQCNSKEGGRQMDMQESVNKLHGEGTSNELYRLSKGFCKLGKFELGLIAEEYKKKFDDLVKIKGNPWKDK